jgi:hypothetical protein
MTAKQGRYRIERVQGSAELGQLQDRIGPVLEKISRDTETSETALSSAAGAGGTSYTPGAPGDWASPAPTTVQSALDRLAAIARTLNGGTPVP